MEPAAPPPRGEDINTSTSSSSAASSSLNAAVLPAIPVIRSASGSGDASASASAVAAGAGAPANEPRRTSTSSSSLKAWRRLQKSTKRVVMGPPQHLSVQQALSDRTGSSVVGAVDDQGEFAARSSSAVGSSDAGAASELGAPAVVLDMDGGAPGAKPEEDGSMDAEQSLLPSPLGLGLNASRHRAIKTMIDVVPTIISEEAEQGLELLAHAVAADAQAAEAEAAEAQAAARGDDEDDSRRLDQEDSRPLLGPTPAEVLRVASQHQLELAQQLAGQQQLPTQLQPQQLPPQLQSRLSQHEPLRGADGQATLPSQAPAFAPKDHASHGSGQHSHPGRKAAITAKQQLVRTLMLPKEGETVEMELPVKDLLRYIQNAVRAVHIGHAQYQTQQSLGGSLTGHGKEGGGGGGGGPVLHPQLSQQPSMRRPTTHSRAYSQSNVGAMASRVMPVPTGGLLNARDVRRLISGLDTESVKNKEMNILVRRHTIVLDLDVIRCLILWDRLIVVVPEGADGNCFEHLEQNLRWLRVQQRAFDMGDADEEDEEEEFEFLALEAVLMTVCNQFKSRLKELRPHIIKNAKALQGNGTLNTKHQDTLRQLKSKVALYQNKARSLHRAIFELLDDEEHLQMLHLTRIITNQQLLLASGADGGEGTGAGAGGGGYSSYGGGFGGGGGYAAVDADRDDEAEILLESYLGDFNEIIVKWELIKEDMLNTENYTLMKLDMARNKLLTIGTIFALVNLCFAFTNVISGTFGMNLFNGVSEGSGSPDSFPFFVGVVSFMAAAMLIIGGSTMAYMYYARILVT